jgi:hypothetical protein
MNEERVGSLYMTNSKANAILKSFERGIRINETSHSTPEWQSDYDGGPRTCGGDQCSHFLRI